VFEHDALGIEQRASTGSLPPRSRVAELVAEAHERYAALDEGEVADYIPVLAAADAARFGLSVMGVDGALHVAGDVGIAFAIQAVAKAFVGALVCVERGTKRCTSGWA
jgi:glutaminase